MKAAAWPSATAIIISRGVKQMTGYQPDMPRGGGMAISRKPHQ